MAREIPEVVRAAAGLAATVVDEARKLPETLPGLPVRLIGMAMQHAMKVQQQYAGLVARGDELFTGLRGENEPGLATFDDDDVEPATVTRPSNGYRESAFDRAGDSFPLDETLTDDEVRTLPADPPADAVTAVVDELADQVETGQQSIEELTEEAPAIEEILDEIAIDELVDQAPTLEETSPDAPALSLVQDTPATEDAAALESALLESDDSAAATAEPDQTPDVATSVDVLTPDGEIATVDAAVTDEGIAAPETPAAEAAAPEAPAAEAEGRTTTKPRKAAKASSGKGAKAGKRAEATDTAATETNAGPARATDESGSDVAAATGVRTDVGASDTSAEDSAIAEGAAVDAVGETSAAPTDDPQGASELSGSQAAGTAPIDGYDGFSIAQLRGRLRGYALSTVQDLLAYEEATRAREPYVRLLRNRLEKLEQQAVESSPLAPRGA
ncbi:hypothetical protein FHU33_4108 [Blastococcus colisei]|uniref:Lipid droplet-associated protein n=1 Tax=Blastococcus colisei TaxID=1564162 RepID=A0A543P032_9ACTN|nr:hypothetical protein [Blastococcus colisei]TQN37456.1 hypothetical protein FHU33_4108 [Blastococcus colisei]